MQRNDFKLIVSGVMVALMFMLFSPGAHNVFAGNNKVTICHKTESETTPYTRTVVNENATSGHFENNGTPKTGHEDDILLQGEQDCPAAPTPTPTITIYITPFLTETEEYCEGGDTYSIRQLCPSTLTPTPTVTPTPTAGNSATPTPTTQPEESRVTDVKGEAIYFPPDGIEK